MWPGLGLAWGPVQGSHWLPEGLGAQAPASCLCLGLLRFLCGKKGIARNNTWFKPGGRGPSGPKDGPGTITGDCFFVSKVGVQMLTRGDHMETQHSCGEPPGKGLSLPMPQWFTEFQGEKSRSQGRSHRVIGSKHQLQLPRKVNTDVLSGSSGGAVAQ